MSVHSESYIFEMNNNFDIKEDLNGEIVEFELVSYDIANVRADPFYSRQKIVTIGRCCLLSW